MPERTIEKILIKDLPDFWSKRQKLTNGSGSAQVAFVQRSFLQCLEIYNCKLAYDKMTNQNSELRDIAFEYVQRGFAQRFSHRYDILRPSLAIVLSLQYTNQSRQLMGDYGEDYTIT